MGPRPGESEEEYKKRKRAEHEARKAERAAAEAAAAAGGDGGAAAPAEPATPATPADAAPVDRTNETREERHARHEREKRERDERRRLRDQEAAAAAAGAAAPAPAPAPVAAPAAAAAADAGGDNAGETREERAARHERERLERDERRRKRKEDEERKKAEEAAAAAAAATSSAAAADASGMGNAMSSDVDARAQRDADRDRRNKRRDERGGGDGAGGMPPVRPGSAKPADSPALPEDSVSGGAPIVVPKKSDNETPEERDFRHKMEREARRRLREADRLAQEQVSGRGGSSTSANNVFNPPSPSSSKSGGTVTATAAAAASSGPAELDQGYVEDFEDTDDLSNNVARWIKSDNPAVREALRAQAVPKTAAIVEAEGTARAGYDRAALEEQRAKARFERDYARATALRRVVDLEEARFPQVADIAPLSQYDMFVRGVGGAGARNTVGEQMPERASVGTQPDKVKTYEKPCAAPIDLGLDPDAESQRFAASSTSSSAAATSSTDAKKATAAAAADSNAKSAMAALARRSVDTASLSRFLNRAGGVVLSLLDEESELREKKAKGAAGGPQQQQNAAAAAGMLSFATQSAAFSAPFAANRPVGRVVCNAATSQSFLVVHGAPNNIASAAAASVRPGAAAAPAGGVDAFQGLVTVWNAHSPQAPEKVLVAFSEIKDACFSRSRPHLVYGGTASGSVCVWDLREPATVHGGHSGAVALRLPSFTTDSTSLNHAAPVQRVVSCGATGGSSGSAAGDSSADGGGSVEQLASVDRTGCLSFWVLSESSQLAADIAATTTGGGALESLLVASMSGGSCVRLHRMGTSATLDSSRGIAAKSGGGAGSAAAAKPNFAAEKENTAGGAASSSAAVGGIVATITDMEQSPVDATRLVIAAFTGVAHVSRFGSIAAPVSYGPTRLAAAPGLSSGGASGSGMTAASTCLAQCRSDPRLLLVGYADGTLRLYLRVDASPKLTVFSTHHKSIVAVCFAPNTVWLAFALDADGNVFAMDFATAGRSKPFAHSRAVRGGAAGDIATSLTTFIDERSETRLLIGFRSGAVEIHTFNDSALAPTAQRNKYWL